MLPCGFSWRRNRNHYYLLLVQSCVLLPHIFIHVCMYVYLPKQNKQMHYYYDPYRSTMGIFFIYITICFGTEYDANLEIMFCQVLLYHPLHTSRSEE